MDALLRKDILVLCGTQIGGRLAKEKTDTTCFGSIEKVYEKEYVTAFFLTLTADPAHGPLAFSYQLDEQHNDSGEWVRKVGVAHLVDDNAVAICECGGATGRLSLIHDGRFILYRSGSAHDSTFVQCGVAELSSIHLRNKMLACNCFADRHRINFSDQEAK